MPNGNNAINPMPFYGVCPVIISFYQCVHPESSLMNVLNTLASSMR